MTPTPSAFPAFLEAHRAEISLTGHAEHYHHAPGEIGCYTTQFSDQNVIIDQRDTLYAYKATHDLDTMYRSKVITPLTFTHQISRIVIALHTVR